MAKEMDDRTKALTALLKAQKVLYKSLAEKAEKLVEGIHGGAPMDDLLRLISEREVIIKRLDSGYGEMRETVSQSGNEALLEDEKVIALKTEIESLIRGVMETDETAVRLLKDAFTEAQSDLSAMSAGHKTISTYGKKGKPAFAKYFDRKF